MKRKKYVRPDVYCESFELSHHIAACTGTIVKRNSLNDKDCGATIIKDPIGAMIGQTIFAADGFCGSDDTDEYVNAEGYCYTNHDNMNGYFGS